MRGFSSALTSAAVAVALLAGTAPAGAASLHASPAVIKGDSHAAIQPVHERRYRYRSRSPHFSFGFGFPTRPHAYYRHRCPYGSHYRYPVGCVRDYYPRYYSRPYYRPGVSIEFGF